MMHSNKIKDIELSDKEIGNLEDCISGIVDLERNGKLKTKDAFALLTGLISNIVKHDATLLLSYSKKEKLENLKKNYNIRD